MKRKSLKRIMTLMLALAVAADIFAFGTDRAYADEEYRYIMPRTIYMNEGWAVRVCRHLDDLKYIDVKSVKSSDPKILKVKKTEAYANGVLYYDYELEPKKPGKVVLTSAFEDEEGNLRTITRTLRVRKRPNFIEYIKLNGKALDLSQNVSSVFATTNKTKLTIKCKLKNGWKKTAVNGAYYNKNNKQVKIPEKELKRILKGKSFSFPKKYNGLYLFISMEKGEDYLHYYIRLYRR